MQEGTRESLSLVDKGGVVYLTTDALPSIRPGPFKLPLYEYPRDPDALPIEAVILSMPGIPHTI
jgi:hypothetical protein